MRRLALALLLAAAAGLPAAPGDQERVLRYHADLRVLADGALEVTEHIRIHAEGQIFRHGIYRDLPTTYQKPGAYSLLPWRAPFEFNGCLRDGQSEGWHQKAMANGKRIYVGEKNVLLETGQDYDYELRYRYERMLGYFSDHDELYWNVTGNGWDINLEDVSASVELPPTASSGQVLSLDGYSGRQGERGRDWTARDLGDGKAEFAVTRVLHPGEGFTLAVGWPKGLVPEPSARQRLHWAYLDYREPALVLPLLLAALGLLLWNWVRFGQDPAMRAAVPRWDPPRGLSPAALRHLDGRGEDATALTASLLDLAVKGHLHIAKKPKGYLLTPQEGAAALEPGEAGLAALLKKEGPVETAAAGDVTFFRRLLVQHTAELHADHKVDIKYNTQRLLPSAGLLLGGIAFTSWLGDGEAIPKLVMGAVGMGIMTAAGALLAIARDGLRPGRIGIHWGQVLGLGAVGLVLMGFGAGIGLASATAAEGLWPALLGGSGGLLLGVFGVWMPRPSDELQRLRDEIQGFTLYLGTAERQRLEYLHPPQDTPQLFEKLLPYAVALDVSNTWGKRFKTVLEEAAARGDYQPTWCSGFERGGILRRNGISSLGSSFASGLGSSISSASAPPGSSSGGGGGGSSGGGGGGGGGGGW